VDWKGLACPYECFVHLKFGIYEMATISVLIFNIPVDPYGKYLKLSLDVQNHLMANLSGFVYGV
jgi:hypothetical protein